MKGKSSDSASEQRNGLESYLHNDEEGVLLRANRNEGELAVCNATVIPAKEDGRWHCLYRAVIGTRYGLPVKSVIKHKELVTPTETIGESRTIIQGKFSYEDPRVSVIGGQYYITCTDYNGNAKVALYITEDFAKIKRFGIISPQIPLEEAISIVPEGRYKTHFSEILEEKRKRAKKPARINDKDAVVCFNNDRWSQVHRIEPDVQIASASCLDDFKSDDFWRDWIKNIEKNIFVRAEEYWEQKIGLGSPFELEEFTVWPYHGAFSEGCGWIYSGSFCASYKNHPEKLVSKIKTPLLQPGIQNPSLTEYDSKGKIKCIKWVYFPASAIVQNNRVYVYSGIGDSEIVWRTTSKDWLLGELRNSHNRV